MPDFDTSLQTICAIATPTGGAIGIVRVSGPEAISIVDSIFRVKTGKPLKERKAYTIAYGTISDDNGDELDDVLASLFRAPHSYTGEDSVELACHGSPYILNKVLQLLTSHGCRMAEAGEYTRRAFLNGKMDLSQAEGVADLIAARSAAGHRLAYSQMRGSVSQRLGELRNRLLQLTSLLELELDFSDHEDLEFADRHELLTLARQTAAEISRLAATFTAGNALKEGVSVAIVGAPNVGKSTLLNALVGDDRAIVSPESGTTRDLIEDTTTLGGILFRFIDTAGLRHTTNRIEQIGIERTAAAAAKARIIIMMTQPGIPYPTLATRQDQTVIRIENKTPYFQAINGTGLPWLEQQLINAAKATGDDTNTVLISNIRHKQALDLAHADLLRTIESLQDGVSTDLVAEDLRQCLSHLAEIVGEVTTPDVLSNIFSHFCVGK